ncbi:MAG: sodium:solute symporter family protein [candidate division KSB1 bacterium]|nr:sodium:solute symporter family protein [candidate division KSB1 bacterium]
MQILGLHWLDALVILGYVAVIMYLGHRAGRGTQDTEDFYIAGRRLGRVYQFFLNFGNATNADQAVAVSREVYRTGISGMWIQYLVLFLTPFYWFTALLFRRSRMITVGDYFVERFRSVGLGAAYAAFILLMAFIGGGVGYMVAAKTMMALTPKPYEKYTPEERLAVEQFREFQVLRSKLDLGLTPEEQKRYEELNERNKRGELKSFISYTDPVKFYFVYGGIVGVYTMMGGFTAAALTDSVQGVLMIVFSILLIPLGLFRIGGFRGLHASVPDYMFHLFGSVTLSDYAWYTIVGMVLANLVSIVAVSTNMAVAGSAKDEMTARVGVLSGMFFKRFLMIFWALAGLLAIGLYAGQLHDPDLIWGYMTRDLLFPGGIGLMLAGILAANMSTLDAGSVSNAALFIRNLYQPLVPNKSERHYINVGRVVIAVTLLGGIGAALFIDDLLSLYKYFISIPAIFGAPIWLGYVWRRLTKPAVVIQIVLSLTIYAVIPNLFQSLEWARKNPAFLLETKPRVVEVRTKAVQEDVEKGLAERVGQPIVKRRVIEPVAVLFDQVARENPEDPNSPKIGLGRFNAEIWVLSWLGIDFTGFTKAQLVATRFFFDALFPFVVLFLFSYLTKPLPKDYLDRFFAKLHTPVQPSRDLDEKALQEAYRNPARFERQKLFPGSNWEILKPSKADLLGFGGSWIVVGLLIVLLWLAVRIQ